MKKYNSLPQLILALFVVLFMPLILSAQVGTTTAFQPDQAPYTGYPQLKLSTSTDAMSVLNIASSTGWYNPFVVSSATSSVNVLFIGHQNIGIFGKNDEFVVDCNGDNIADYRTHYAGNKNFSVAAVCNYTRPGTYTVRGTVVTSVKSDYTSPYGNDSKYANNYVSTNCPSGCYAKATITLLAPAGQRSALSANMASIWNAIKSVLNLFKI